MACKKRLFMTRERMTREQMLKLFPPPSPKAEGARDAYLKIRYGTSSNYSSRIKSLIRRDGEYCQCCGATENLVADHIIPKSWGGTNRLENRQLLCSPCNAEKSNHHATYYRENKNANKK